MFDHFDILAPFYDWFLGSSHPKSLGRLLKLPCRGWMLDAGGGTGRVSAHFRQSVGNLVVSDTSRQMLLQSIRKRINAVLAEIEKLPFPDSSFDRVVIVDALHHFYDQQTALRESLRVLRTGGRLIIEEPDFNQFVVRAAAIVEKIFRMRSCFLTPEEICKIISDCGQAARIEETGGFRSWILVDKV